MNSPSDRHRVSVDLSHHIFDEPTNTHCRVVKDPASAACAVIDSVMNLDYPISPSVLPAPTRSSLLLPRSWNGSETHVPRRPPVGCALHPAAPGWQIAIGFNISVVRRPLAGCSTPSQALPATAPSLTCCCARRRHHPDRPAGRYPSMHTPGHTPACMTTVLVTRYSSATPVHARRRHRLADFPGGDAHCCTGRSSVSQSAGRHAHLCLATTISPTVGTRI